MNYVSSEMTVKELKAKAKSLEIAGYSKMREDELVLKINKHIKESEMATPKSKKETKKEEPKVEDKKAMPVTNDFISKFMVGSELKVEGLPFVVKEVRGLELVLKRTDIK